MRPAARQTVKTSAALSGAENELADSFLNEIGYAKLQHTQKVHMVKSHYHMAFRVPYSVVKEQRGRASPGFVGGDNRDRTGDLSLAKAALSQLSYIPGKYKDICWWA